MTTTIEKYVFMVNKYNAGALSNEIQQSNIETIMSSYDLNAIKKQFDEEIKLFNQMLE